MNLFDVNVFAFVLRLLGLEESKARRESCLRDSGTISLLLDGLAMFLVEVLTLLLAEFTQTYGKVLELLLQMIVVGDKLVTAYSVQGLDLDDEVAGADLVLQAPSLLERDVQYLRHLGLISFQVGHVLEVLRIDILLDLKDGRLVLQIVQRERAVTMGHDLTLGRNVLQQLAEVLIKVRLEVVAL